ncbi:MAG: hypothetical protein IJ141_06605 [Lachnospiraceae bacterium]|nr:hypothetical protein [Lachnospiraceae bacterium]
MTFSEIDYNDNHYKLNWISGELEGFFIDFKFQEIGFKDNEPQRIEYKKLQIIKYLMEHSDEYITGTQINLTEELNSIDLPKSISSIKSSIIKALCPAFEKEKAAELYNSIIDKHKINGQMGYKLLISDTVLSDVSSDFSKKDNSEDTDVIKTAHDEAASQTDYNSDDSFSYMTKNWFMLFVIGYILLMLLFIMKANNISIGSLFKRLVTLPLKISFFICIAGGILPILAGLLVDTPYALISHRIKSGKKADISNIQNIVANVEGRFDLSKKHLLFFSTCNLSGAITVASAILFVKRIPYFDTYIEKGSLTFPLNLIALAGIFVAVYNNFMLQTKEASNRNRCNYILTRAHAFFNFFWLSFSLTISCGLLFGFLLFKINSSYATPAVLDSSYLIMILAAYSFLWFSADSPMADDIDSISKDNFISGAPVLAFFAILYTTLCFDVSFTCIMSLIINALVLAIWYIVVSKRKSIGFFRFATSFFTVIAVIVILMLILNI